MKVVHLIDSGGLYGAEVMLLSLIEEQIKLGMICEVISLGLVGQEEKELELELINRGVTVHPLRMPAMPRFSQSMSILNTCKKIEADIIHSHGYKGNILLGLIPKFLRKIPVVTTLHGYTKHKLFSKMTVNQLVDKIVIRCLDAIILVSPSIYGQALLFGVRGITHVVPNGIPIVDEVDVIKSRIDNEFIIGTIGRLCKEKNFLFIIRVMPKILKIIPTAKLLIHGEGSDRRMLELEIDRLGLSGCVELLGYVKKPHDFLKRIDLYVNCSLTEGMPISLLEAMRAKCSILASNIKANRLLLDGDYSIPMLFELNEIAFLSGLKNHINSSDLVKNKQKAKLHMLFSTSYTSKGMADKYQRIYEEVAL